jgi:hypothetical protein
MPGNGQLGHMVVQQSNLLETNGMLKRVPWTCTHARQKTKKNLRLMESMELYISLHVPALHWLFENRRHFTHTLRARAENFFASRSCTCLNHLRQKSASWKQKRTDKHRDCTQVLTMRPFNVNDKRPRWGLFCNVEHGFFFVLFYVLLLFFVLNASARHDCP